MRRIILVFVCMKFCLENSIWKRVHATWNGLFACSKTNVNYTVGIVWAVFFHFHVHMCLYVLFAKTLTSNPNSKVRRMPSG